MRVALTVAVAALALAGCGSGAAEGRAGKCADLMTRLAPETHTQVSQKELRAYALRAYCRRFARNGWVYPDGAMSIDAQKWLVGGMRCATSTGAGGTTTVPCEVVEDAAMDCAMLHYVRRAEARAYIAELERRGPVSCDDGTPPADLGVP